MKYLKCTHLRMEAAFAVSNPPACCASQCVFMDPEGHLPTTSNYQTILLLLLSNQCMQAAHDEI